MKLSVIIPVYNEEATVVSIIDRVRQCGVSELDIIVVNDCSDDGTASVLDAMPSTDDLRIIHHETNLGKGSAIRTAQGEVQGDVVVIQDADLEYDPVEFPRMLQIIEEDRADVVYGSRYSGRDILVDSFWHYLGNKFLTVCSNLMSNLHLTDMETCYKMIRADVFMDMVLQCARFGIEPEITAKLAKRDLRIYEVPIAYKARRFDEGKKIGWRDGIAALWYILKYNLFS